MEHFHKLLAKHQNALRGRWEAFWASEQTSVVELVKPEDVLAKMVYAIANPVSSHLVDKVHHWPGVESLAAIDHNLPLMATKPSRFFDQNNKDLPELLELRFDRAPAFEHLSRDEYARLLRDEVAKAEKAAADERREKGITIVGRAAILKQHWSGQPSTHEPRRGQSPRVACKNKWARIEALQRNKVFIEQYRDARVAKLTGQDVILLGGRPAPCRTWSCRFPGAPYQGPWLPARLRVCEHRWECQSVWGVCRCPWPSTGVGLRAFGREDLIHCHIRTHPPRRRPTSPHWTTCGAWV